MEVTELPISGREQAAEFLKDFDLVYTDLDQPNVRIFRFEDSGLLIGIGGLEIFGDLALLRSVAVAKEFQGKKAGRFICNWIEDWARKNQLSELYLLTTTAPDFFAHLNYRVIQRDEFPEPLRQTSQFSQLCPASAICMKKIL
jgi:amino-acid N-acetyltransferase